MQFSMLTLLKNGGLYCLQFFFFVENTILSQTGHEFIVQ